MDASHVRSFVEKIERGLFQTLPDGIAFHQDSWLANGHHRLNAIVRSGRPVFMWVARGLTDDDILALDQGKKRTMSDLTGINRKITDCINYAARLLDPVNKRLISAQDVLKAMELPFAKKLIELHSRCNDHPRVFGSAPVRCASVFWALNGCEEYSFQQYVALNRMEFNNFSPISSLFAKRVTLNQIGGKNSDELFAISMRVFDQSKASYKKLYSTSEDARNEFRKLGSLIF